MGPFEAAIADQSSRFADCTPEVQTSPVSRSEPKDYTLLGGGAAV